MMYLWGKSGRASCHKRRWSSATTAWFISRVVAGP